MSPPARIALLGAPGTGKSTLARELQQALGALGRRATVIPPPLPDAAAPEAPPGGNAAAACDLLIADGTLLPGAALTLVMGLDLPTAAAAACQAEDARLRSELAIARVPYQVVYGTGPVRLATALAALRGAGVLPAGVLPAPPSEAAAAAWTWRCEKCSDPVCEHRLFRRLLGHPSG